MYSHILWKLSQSINKKIIVTLKLDIKLQLRDIKSQLWEIELQLLFSDIITSFFNQIKSFQWCEKLMCEHEKKRLFISVHYFFFYHPFPHFYAVPTYPPAPCICWENENRLAHPWMVPGGI